MGSYLSPLYFCAFFLGGGNFSYTTITIYLFTIVQWWKIVCMSPWTSIWIKSHCPLIIRKYKLILSIFTYNSQREFFPSEKLSFIPIWYLFSHSWKVIMTFYLLIIIQKQVIENISYKTEFWSSIPSDGNPSEIYLLVEPFLSIFRNLTFKIVTVGEASRGEIDWS